MAYFILKTTPEDEGTRYEVPVQLTFGEQKEVLREFGVDAAGMGVMWIAVRRRYPNTTIQDLDNVYIEVFEDEDDGLPPTFAAANSSDEENAKQTTNADTGNHGSDSTTE